jgi:hypothetical protein
MDTWLRNGREPNTSWTYTRHMLYDRFIPYGYEQYLFQWYQYYLQGNKSIHEYNVEFQKITKYNIGSTGYKVFLGDWN